MATVVAARVGATARPEIEYGSRSIEPGMALERSARFDERYAAHAGERGDHIVSDVISVPPMVPWLTLPKVERALVAEMGERLLEYKIYRDTSPLLKDKIQVEVWAVSAPESAGVAFDPVTLISVGIVLAVLVTVFAIAALTIKFFVKAFKIGEEGLGKLAPLAPVFIAVAGALVLGLGAVLLVKAARAPRKAGAA